MTHDSAIARLSGLLEAEQLALRAGDLSQLEAFTEEKAALAAQLEASDLTGLRSLEGALNRNGALLAAARDGVEQVVKSLRAQQNARTTLSSYDPAGKPKTISQPRGQTERRF